MGLTRVGAENGSGTARECKECSAKLLPSWSFGGADSPRKTTYQRHAPFESQRVKTTGADGISGPSCEGGRFSRVLQTVGDRLNQYAKVAGVLPITC